MTEPINEPSAEVQIDADLFTSPLRSVALEIHEIYEELQAVGFPERALVQIVAHIVSDTVLYKDDYIVDEDDEDDDEEGDTLDGTGLE